MTLITRVLLVPSKLPGITTIIALYSGLPLHQQKLTTSYNLYRYNCQTSSLLNLDGFVAIKTVIPHEVNDTMVLMSIKAISIHSSQNPMFFGTNQATRLNDLFNPMFLIAVNQMDCPIIITYH